MILRDYQTEAVEAVKAAFTHGKKRLLLSMSTGSGKSLVLAEIAKRTAKYRVLILCHQKEILEQNEKAFRALSDETVSVYCAGLKRKELEARVVIAHRDSLAKLTEMPQFDLVIIDEAHLCSRVPTSVYQRILKATGPRWVIGLTATPYRLQGGKIYGSGKQFEICAYTVNIASLIARGYLSPYSVVDTVPILHTDDVGKKGNDFDLVQLDAKARQSNILDGSVNAILEHTKNRALSLIFCTSRAHAKEIQKRLPGCGYIDGETKDRDTIISDMRDGDIRYVVNVGVLTTGVDIPRIDCVVMLRPTMSASLFVQMVGRGLRTHPGKEKLLILELTDNLIRFGDLDDPMLFGEEKVPDLTVPIGLPAPKKECPSCRMPVSAGCRVCPLCDFLFLKPREEYSEDEIVELQLINFREVPLATRSGPIAIVVTFETRIGNITEWLNINHPHQGTASTSKAKLRRLRNENIIRIRVRGLNQKFPKVLSYHTT